MTMRGVKSLESLFWGISGEDEGGFRFDNDMVKNITYVYTIIRLLFFFILYLFLLIYMFFFFFMKLRDMFKLQRRQ